MATKGKPCKFRVAAFNAEHVEVKLPPDLKVTSDNGSPDVAADGTGTDTPSAVGNMRLHAEGGGASVDRDVPVAEDPDAIASLEIILDGDAPPATAAAAAQASPAVPIADQAAPVAGTVDAPIERSATGS